MLNRNCPAGPLPQTLWLLPWQTRSQLLTRDLFSPSSAPVLPDRTAPPHVLTQSLTNPSWGGDVLTSPSQREAGSNCPSHEAACPQHVALFMSSSTWSLVRGVCGSNVELQASLSPPPHLPQADPAPHPSYPQHSGTNSPFTPPARPPLRII